MANETKEILDKLESISIDTAVIKNDIMHIKDKLGCLEKDNDKQNKRTEKMENKVDKLNLELTKIAIIVSIFVSAIVFVIKEVIL